MTHTVVLETTKKGIVYIIAYCRFLSIPLTVDKSVRKRPE